MEAVPKELRPGRKLLLAVADLHTRGYQRLRILPERYDSFGGWRCAIAPAQWISSFHGAIADRNSPAKDLPTYKSGDGGTYWGWKDESNCSAGDLAAEFLERFPQLAELGYGEDWMYVGWYQHMLHVTYPDALPISNSAHEPLRGVTIDFTLARDSEPDGYMTTLGRSARFALPPAGYAQ